MNEAQLREKMHFNCIIGNLYLCSYDDKIATAHCKCFISLLIDRKLLFQSLRENLDFYAQQNLTAFDHVSKINKIVLQNRKYLFCIN